MERYPLYYDIAFQFRDIKKECDFLETCWKKFSKVKVNSVLDVTCGTGAHMLELAKRGYEVYGFDLSTEMVRYVRKIAEENKVNLKVFKKDMRKFSFNKKFDSAICVGYAFSYLLENSQVLRHLKCIDSCLKKGATYILELPHPREILTRERKGLDAWTEKKDGVEVNVEYKEIGIDWVRKIVENSLCLKVKDGGREKEFKEIFKLRIFFPDELRALIELSQKFRLIKFFGGLEEKELDSKESAEIVAVLRKI